LTVSAFGELLRNASDPFLVTARRVLFIAEVSKMEIRGPNCYVTDITAQMNRSEYPSDH
jgi:hypothetical protein